MNRDELDAKLKQLAVRFQSAAPERTKLEAPPTRTRRRRPAPLASWPRSKATLEDLLETFTPATAYAFIYARTVPPASDDGLQLIACYPELSAAAPELVEDMAAAFRTKQPHEYSAYFQLVARHHGIEVRR